MDNIIDIIKTEIAQDYYQQNFSNDGQRFVAWYMRNIHLLDLSLIIFRLYKRMLMIN